MVIMWNSRTVTVKHIKVWGVTWKLTHYLSGVTGSSTVKSVTCSYFQIPFVWHVYSHRYLWCISNRFTKSASLMKCCVSTTSIYETIKLVNITFQGVPCIHAEWTILGDDVPWTCCAASPRLIFYWNTATGLYYWNDRLILRPNVEINCKEYFHATYFLEHVEC